MRLTVSDMVALYRPTPCPVHVADILKYNEEDLTATWVVFEWLREKGCPLTIPAGGRRIRNTLLETS
jgi:hypothetical protein